MVNAFVSTPLGFEVSLLYCLYLGGTVGVAHSHIPAPKPQLLWNVRSLGNHLQDPVTTLLNQNLPARS